MNRQVEIQHGTVIAKVWSSDTRTYYVGHERDEAGWGFWYTEHVDRAEVFDSPTEAMQAMLKRNAAYPEVAAREVKLEALSWCLVPVVHKVVTTTTVSTVSTIKLASEEDAE